MSRNHFNGWLYDYAVLPLSVTHEGYFEGAKVVVGYDDDGNRVITAPIVKFSKSGMSVQTQNARWRLSPAFKA